MTTNYAHILTKTDDSYGFHVIQDFPSSSEVGYALQEPSTISGRSVIQIWTTELRETPEDETDVLQFTHEDIVFDITPEVVRETLYLPATTEFDAQPDDETMKNFLL